MNNLNLIIIGGLICSPVLILLLIEYKTKWISKFIFGDPIEEIQDKPKRKGVIPSEETRAKRSATFLAKMNSEEGHAKWGSPEHRAKLSAAAKGRKAVWTEEAKKAHAEKISKAFKGRVFSEEHKAKISQAKKGCTRKPMSPEARERVRQAAILRHQKQKEIK